MIRKFSSMELKKLTSRGWVIDGQRRKAWKVRDGRRSWVIDPCYRRLN